jgi:hypothetical protein
VSCEDPGIREQDIHAQGESETMPAQNMGAVYINVGQTLAQGIEEGTGCKVQSIMVTSEEDAKKLELLNPVRDGIRIYVESSLGSAPTLSPDSSEGNSSAPDSSHQDGIRGFFRSAPGFFVIFLICASGVFIIFACCVGAPSKQSNEESPTARGTELVNVSPGPRLDQTRSKDDEPGRMSGDTLVSGTFGLQGGPDQDPR